MFLVGNHVYMDDCNGNIWEYSGFQQVFFVGLQTAWYASIAENHGYSIVFFKLDVGLVGIYLALWMRYSWVLMSLQWGSNLDLANKYWMSM